MASPTIIAESAVTEQSVSQIPMDDNDSRLFETVKQVYKSDHQAEYLDIKAQVESLLQQLQANTQPLASSIEQR